MSLFLQLYRKSKKVEVALPLHHFTEMKILDKFLILLIGRARIFAFLSACGSNGVSVENGDYSKIDDCSVVQESMKRDECYHDKIRELSSKSMNEVLSIAAKIEDRMVRGAAVSAWVKENNSNINQQQGKQLCKMLDGRDRFYCMRRLSSPHLKR